MKSDLEPELRDWLRRQEPDRSLFAAPLQEAVARAAVARQAPGGWLRLASAPILAAAGALAVLGVVAIVSWSSGPAPAATGPQSAAPIPTSSPTPGAPSPSPLPSPLPSPTAEAPGPYSWFTFDAWREGSTVEGPQNPTGPLHLMIRAGVDTRVTVDVERIVDSPVPPVEEGAAPFASAADGSLLYGFTSTDGAELREITIADGKDAAVLELPAAVPWATLDREAGRVYLVRFGLKDRQYEGIWEATIADHSERRLLAPSAGVYPAGTIRLYLTPGSNRLVVLECEPMRPCLVRVWEIAGDRAGVEVGNIPFDDVYGLTDTEIIIGRQRVNLDTGLVSSTGACRRGVVIATAAGPVLVYEADIPAWPGCEGDDYRLEALDLSTGRRSPVWSSADPGADPAARLLVPESGLGLFLPPSTIALSPEGFPPPDGVFLVPVETGP